MDGAGNVYIADTANNAIKKWTAANNTVTTLVSSGLMLSLWRGGGWRGQCLYRRHRQQRDQGTAPCLRGPDGQMGRRWRWQRCVAGGAARHRKSVGAVRAHQRPAWLTITGVTNGVVSFAFTAATSQPHGHTSPCWAKPSQSRNGLAIRWAPPIFWKDRRRAPTAWFWL